MKSRNLVRFSTFVASLSLISACGDAGGIVLDAPADTAEEGATEEESLVMRDPALKLTSAQIIDLYSRSSCDALQNDDEGPVFDDDMTNGVANGNLPDYQRGLRANVYVPPEGFQSADWLTLTRFQQPDVRALPNVLYFFNLDVPTRSFNKGFPLFDGSLLEGFDEKPLVEYFRIDFDGFVELGEDDTEGQYEFALLSDDGAVLEMGLSNTKVIDHPLHTPSKLMCGTAPVSMKQGFSQPMKLSWFQGPRFHIANMMLWRKAGSGAEPLCGRSGNELWFDYNAGPYVKKQAFLDLESRGWKVVAPKNFRLPVGELMNPCSSPRVQQVFSGR